MDSWAIMDFRITTLVENTVALSGSRLIGEHGLCFLIESGTQKILFDTGQQLALAHNAGILSIDLGRIQTVVLSHGHYDHTGGLKDLLKKNTHFRLYAHPDVFDDKLRSADKGTFKSIGMPIGKQAFANSGVRIKLHREACEISPGIITSGEIPMETNFESVESGFFVKRGGRIVDDTLADDQALIFETRKGPVVLLGCSHRGIINILNHVKKLMGAKNIHAILGGLHLAKASDEKMDTIIDNLREFGLQRIGVGHCTGSKALFALQRIFADRLFINAVGNTVTFSDLF